MAAKLCTYVDVACSLEPSTTVLSPYLKFGCLSSRLFWHRLDAIYKAHKGHALPPVSLHGQLLWREFFYFCGDVVENYGQMRGNPICRQIPWDTNAETLKGEYHRFCEELLLVLLHFCGDVMENYGQMRGNPICRQIPWDTNVETLKGE